MSNFQRLEELFEYYLLKNIELNTDNVNSLNMIKEYIFLLWYLDALDLSTLLRFKGRVKKYLDECSYDDEIFTEIESQVTIIENKWHLMADYVESAVLNRLKATINGRNDSGCISYLNSLKLCQSIKKKKNESDIDIIAVLNTEYCMSKDEIRKCLDIIHSERKSRDGSLID